MELGFTDTLYVSLAAVVGFQMALAADYFLLKFLLRIMRSGVPRKHPESNLWDFSITPVLKSGLRVHMTTRSRSWLGSALKIRSRARQQAVPQAHKHMQHFSGTQH